MERRDILKTLEGRGAFEDFINLQRELANLEASAATLRERYKAAEILEGESTQLDLDRVNLKRRLQEDHQQRKAALDKAILLIADAINELYDDRTGRFVVDATENGPEFRISIEGDRGGGISNIEIFCLDLALLQLAREQFGGPGFLVHDSHLFDGVDARQIARALLLGAQATDCENLQYIVTMNSDIFDSLPLPDEIDREKVTLTARLISLFRQVRPIFTTCEQKDLGRLGAAALNRELFARDEKLPREGVLNQSLGSKQRVLIAVRSIEK